MKSQMIALRKMTRAAGAELCEIPIPEIKPTEVLIQVHAASICGTDVHIYSWDHWAQNRVKNVPYTIGHETTGEIVKAGSAVTRVHEGDIVSLETHIPCMKCKQCLTGQMHVCANVQILGVDRNGVMAEYLAVPEIVCWRNDTSIPPEYLSIQEPLGNAVHCTLKEPVHGKSVAIYGDGPIGLFSAGVARACGATDIFLAGIDPFRLNIGKKMGADLCINSLSEDPVKIIREKTGGIGADVVLEMSGVESAMNQAIDSLRLGGRFCFFGIFKEDMTPSPLNKIIFNGGTFYGINGRIMFDNWFTVSNLLKSKRLNVEPVVTHKMPMENFAEAFDLMMAVPKKVGKVVLFPDPKFMNGKN